MWPFSSRGGEAGPLKKNFCGFPKTMYDTDTVRTTSSVNLDTSNLSMTKGLVLFWGSVDWTYKVSQNLSQICTAAA